MTTPLPEFDDPPLNEVVIGVQFDRLVSFRLVHFGLYWDKIRGKYPGIEEQLPLPMQLEPSQLSPATGPSAELSILASPPCPRCWFLNETKTQLLQVQTDRFWRNWRQVDGSERYPRFPSLISEFLKDWTEFVSFVKNSDLGQPAVNQCELTYLNHIEAMPGPHSFSDPAGLFSILSKPKDNSFLPKPEMLNWSARYLLPDGRGRLTVHMDPGYRNRDLHPIYILNLTARGAPKDRSGDSLAEWFSVARTWVVKAFDELTSPAMHKFWKKRS
jgi:uncharacterized protein (TIGR04255 family)